MKTVFEFRFWFFLLFFFSLNVHAEKHAEKLPKKFKVANGMEFTTRHSPEKKIKLFLDKKEVSFHSDIRFVFLPKTNPKESLPHLGVFVQTTKSLYFVNLNGKPQKVHAFARSDVKKSNVQRYLVKDEYVWLDLYLVESTSLSSSGVPIWGTVVYSPLHEDQILVQSRLLGRSVGINNEPLKILDYDRETHTAQLSIATNLMNHQFEADFSDLVEKTENRALALDKELVRVHKREGSFFTKAGSDNIGNREQLRTKLEESGFVRFYRDFPFENSKEIQAVLNDPFIKSMRKAYLSGNVLLTGLPGQGKTYHAERFLRGLFYGIFPEFGEVRDIMIIEADKLEGGTGNRGSFEERINLVKSFGGHLFIDEIHNLKGSGSHSNSSVDFFQLLSTATANGQIKFIGTTTDSNFDRVFSGDADVRRRLSRVRVPATSESKGLELLQEFFFDEGLKVSKKFINEVWIASENYPLDGAQPDRSLRLAKKLLAHTRVERGRDQIPNVLDLKIVTAELTGLPEQLMGPAARKDFALEIEQAILEDVSLPYLLQDALIGSTHRFLSKISGHKGPGLSLFLTGPPGTGKTRLSKMYAELLKMNYERIDMSTFSSGFETAERLQSRIAKIIEARPYSLILFEEFDKASKAAQSALLTILDEGSFEANGGRGIPGERGVARQISVHHSAFMVASNAGTRQIFQHYSAAYQSALKKHKGILDGGFLLSIDEIFNQSLPEKKLKTIIIKESELRPEILDRFDYVLPVYHPDVLRLLQTLAHKMEDFQNRMKKDFKIEVNITNSEEFFGFILHQYFQVGRNYRDVDRIIKRLLEAPIARQINLMGEIKRKRSLNFRVEFESLDCAQQFVPKKRPIGFQQQSRIEAL